MLIGLQSPAGRPLMPRWAGHQRLSVSGWTLQSCLLHCSQQGATVGYPLKLVASRDLRCERIFLYFQSNDLLIFIIEDAGILEISSHVTQSHDNVTLTWSSFIHSFIHSFILLYKRHDKTQANKQCTKVNNIQNMQKITNKVTSIEPRTTWITSAIAAVVAYIAAGWCGECRQRHLLS